jgi:hypothetical protein
MQLTCRGFDFCPEVTAKALRLGHKIFEVPIEYQPRSLDEGKKIRAWHGLQALWVLLKFRVLPDEMMFGPAARWRAATRPKAATKPGIGEAAAKEAPPVVVELNVNALSRMAARRQRNRIDESHVTAAG